MSRRRMAGAVVAGTAAALLTAGCNPVAAKPTASPMTTAAVTTSRAATLSASPTSSSAPAAGPTSGPSAGAAASTTTTTTAPGATTTVADTAGWACTIGVTRAGSGDAVPSGTVDVVTFTNIGGAPCRLAGGASAQFVDPEGHTVGAPAALGGGTTLLAPGQSLSARLKTTVTGVFDEERCAAVPVTGVRFTPPVYAAPTDIAGGEKTACSNGGQMTWLDALPTQGEGP